MDDPEKRPDPDLTPLPSEKVVEEHGGRIGDIVVYGLESNSTTRRLAMMNLAIRGIEGDLGPVYCDTFRRDLHKDLKADDVLANPPFNDSDWHRSDEDVRWKYGLPPKGNANFASVQHFIHHLVPSGFAGFVLANGGLSSNQRRKLVIKSWIAFSRVSPLPIVPSARFIAAYFPDESNIESTSRPSIECRLKRVAMIPEALARSDRSSNRSKSIASDLIGIGGSSFSHGSRRRNSACSAASRRRATSSRNSPTSNSRTSWGSFQYISPRNDSAARRFVKSRTIRSHTEAFARVLSGGKSMASLLSERRASPKSGNVIFTVLSGRLVVALSVGRSGNNGKGPLPGNPLHCTRSTSFLSTASEDTFGYANRIASPNRVSIFWEQTGSATRPARIKVVDL